jgi:hypothetical protein
MVHLAELVSFFGPVFSSLLIPALSSFDYDHQVHWRIFFPRFFIHCLAVAGTQQ